MGMLQYRCNMIGENYILVVKSASLISSGEGSKAVSETKKLSLGELPSVPLSSKLAR